MMKTEKHVMGKHEQRIKQKITTAQPDVSDEKALAQLKIEILDMVRKLANGHMMSVYPITERAKEMIALERKMGVAKETTN